MTSAEEIEAELSLIGLVGLALVSAIVVIILLSGIRSACANQVVTRIVSKSSQNLSGLLSITYIVAALATLFGGRLFVWARFLPRFWSMIAGLVLLSLSLVLMTSAFIVMGSQLTWTPQTIQGQKLVVSGPYAIIRHPLLVSFLLANLGAMMYGGAWFPFAMYLPLFGHSLVLLPKEEQFLAEEFGKDYEIYRTKTGKLWPNLFSLVSKNRKQSIINQQYENVSNEESFSRPKNATYGSAVI